jgi:hypothetical protein
MTLMRQPVSLIVIAVLALAQAVLGVLRAREWFQFSTDMSGRGILILPLVSLLAMGRGWLVAIIALLYVVFALGALARQGWAWGLGLVVSLVNGLAIVLLVIEGEVPLVHTLSGAVVPVVIMGYLLAPAGRLALKH